ncbi:excisionase family DNA-binding protein [Yinghuangia sp. YIM S09857]|uniref:excisionase family DNA-binding protein n=1 Tax=Yinghuangia sp. YIM S09857 TaxID=3436929 RepID=UPI003F52CEF4
MVIERRWHTVAEVAVMLGYGVSKTKMLVAQGRIRSVKDGGSRRILPRWVDEYVEQLAREVEPGRVA